jgi:predicted RNA binding protein YcfA (HicA-like mRNA interferase family)
MSRLTPQHYKKLASAYQALGFKLERESSSHLVFWKDGIGMTRPIILPKYSEVGLDIIQNNLRSGKISRKELLEHL